MTKCISSRFIHTILFMFIAFSATFASSCEEQVQYHSVEHFFDMKIKDTNFKTQVALYPAEMAKGLMFRESLGDKESMIFIYASPRRVSFWMKNTLIPLDIGFFDENGKLLEIKSMYPQDLTSVPSSSDKVMYCLEVNPKFFQKNNIKIGDYLDMNLLKKAIESRSMLPNN